MQKIIKNPVCNQFKIAFIFTYIYYIVFLHFTRIQLRMQTIRKTN